MCETNPIDSIHTPPLRPFSMSLRGSIVKHLAGVAMRIWAASGAILIGCFILYCLYGGLIAFSLLMLSVSCILYNAQDQLLYHPYQPAHSRVFVPVPSMHGLPFETVHITAADRRATLHAYWIRHPGERGRHVPTVVYLHGNAGNVGHRLHNAAGMYHRLQCNLLLVEYRGYGLSTGRPSERGLCVDARTAIDYLFERHDVDLQQIVVFGRSLGGAVAVDVCADPEYYQRVMGVVLENTFTSIAAMAQSLLHPAMRYVPSCAYKNRFSSLHKIQFFAAPCLLVSGTEDKLVPPRMMRQLHARCGSVHKRLMPVPGGSHNDSWTVAGYYEGIAAFLQECREYRMPLQTTPPVRLHSWPTDATHASGLVQEV